MLLTSFVLLALGMAIFGYHYRQRVLAIYAHDAIFDKGVDANYSGNAEEGTAAGEDAVGVAIGQQGQHRRQQRSKHPRP